MVGRVEIFYHLNLSSSIFAVIHPEKQAFTVHRHARDPIFNIRQYKILAQNVSQVHSLGSSVPDINCLDFVFEVKPPPAVLPDSFLACWDRLLGDFTPFGLSFL